jgi:hypothetical protein
MSTTRLYAERFLSPIRDDPDPPPQSEYDERRSLTVLGDGTPIVELGTEQTRTFDKRTSAFEDSDDNTARSAWTATETTVRGPGYDRD